MKREFTLIILLLISLGTSAQWDTNHNIDGKCSHATCLMPNALEHLYDWQSPLMDNYDVTFYWLDIEVSNNSTFISGNVTINATSIVSVDTFAFELIPDITIDSFFFEGIKYSDYTRVGDNVLFPVSEVPAKTDFKVQVYYHGDPGSTNILSGLSKAYSELYKKHMVWSLSEPFGAKSWFPVKQDLEDKADSCWVFLTTDSTNMAGSQGILTNKAELDNGKVRYEWKSSYPIVYYLISFAVSDYMEYNIYAHPGEMNGDSLLIQNYIYDDPACLEENKEGIDRTPEMVELFSDLFILYPFHEEKYGHCLTQLGGGMEHQTMSTMGSFGFDLVAHELGHMWFGDNVTCATWSDIWINEGFATYANYLATEFIYGWLSAKSFIRSKQENAMSAPGGSVFIPENQISPENPWRIFSGRLSYDKGASIIHMLRHEIQNDEQFFEILSTFQTDFTDSTATGEDFKNVAENITGMDFDLFFEQWYYGQGYPTYDLVYYQKNDSLHLNLTQTTSTSATTTFEMLMDYKLYFSDGSDSIIQLLQTNNLNTFSVYTGKEVSNIEIDPEDWTMEMVGDISFTIDAGTLPVVFSIGPNPVRDRLNIYFPNNLIKPRKISIQNISGQVMYQENSTKNYIQYDASDLPNGVYIVSVTDGLNSYQRRFIR